MNRSDQDIVIGKIVAPLGTRGEVKVLVLTDFPDRFKTGGELRAKTLSGKALKLKLQACRLHKDGLALKIEGVDARDDAEALRGAEFVIGPEDLKELPSGEFYIFDLIGLIVQTTDGRECGEIVDVISGGANDVYVTSTELCIPALKEVVAEVDFDRGVMIIRPVPGLLD